MCGPVLGHEERKIFIVFKAPQERPTGFMLRGYTLRSYGVVATTRTLGESLEETRAAVPAGMRRSDRKETDPESLVEVWW